MKTRWQDEMACAGNPVPLWDYKLDPPDTEPAPMRARRLHSGRVHCVRCPVKDECLEYAITHHMIGMWGGVLFNDQHEVVELPKRPRDIPESAESRSLSTSESKPIYVLETPREHDRHCRAGDIA